MSRGSRRFRGQPLAAFGLLLTAWVAGRVILWEPLLAKPVAAARPLAVQAAGKDHAASPEHRLDQRHDLSAARVAPGWATRGSLLALPPRTTLVPVFAPAALAREPAPLPPAAALQPLPKAAPGILAPRVAAAHQMAWLAAVAQLPLPPEAALALAPQRPPAARAPSPQRWSADGWLLLRRGGSGASPGGALLPSLGASQAGAVLRYRLAPSSAHRPALYLRASSALQTPRGEELAAGLSLRPLAGVPFAAMAEARLTQTPTGSRLRPALALVSEFPPARLPGGLRGEAYVQGGYVGGTGATAFVDGQARIEAPLLSAGKLHLRAGGGLWGGAQQGASRIDIGPTATLALPLGSGGGRLSADWRFRIAGNAAPASGPALTLSAGF